MSEELDIEPIKSRVAAATKGPWMLGRLVGQHLRPGESACFWCKDGPPLRIEEKAHSSPELWSATIHHHVWPREPSDSDWHDIVSAGGVEITGNYDYECGGVASTRADAEFIASARQDIPALIAEVERLRAQLLAGATPEGQHSGLNLPMSATVGTALEGTAGKPPTGCVPEKRPVPSQQLPSGGHRQSDTDRYHELLYAVESKHVGESRHETALRYIRQAEQHIGGPACSLPAPPAPAQHEEP